jgi:hypothetical protein
MSKNTTKFSSTCNNEYQYEKESFENLKSELISAFSTPDSSYSKLEAKDIFKKTSNKEAQVEITQN